MNIRLAQALFFFFAVTAAFGRPSQAPASATVPLAERVMIASNLYSAIQMYFGHWKGVPDLDLEREYANYIQRILATDSRREFDLAFMEFLAALQHGHSGFRDQWLNQTFGQQIGFYAYPIDGEWVITRSSIKELAVGDIIREIDGESFDSFYQRNRKYISGSDERWRRRALFEYPYLFPESFQVTLKDGRQFTLKRTGEFQSAGSEFHSIETKQKNDVTILRIPGLTPQSFEDSAVEFLKKLPPSKALIIDVRGNHGGSTPGALVTALMDRPYRWMSETTPATFAVLRAWDMLGKHTELAWDSDPQPPDHPLYSGPLYLLIDGGCFSACEDMVAPFKDKHRAVILGEKTGGSIGQPYSHKFSNGMGFSLSTKRDYLPDGSAFEGVGIAPDIEIHTSADDLRKGRDPVLDKALEMVVQRQGEAGAAGNSGNR